MTRQVVVTDMALVAASGVGVSTAWRCLEREESRIAPVSSFDATGLGGVLAAEVPDLPETLGEAGEDRAMRWLRLAGQQLDRSRLGSGGQNGEDRPTALILGTSKGLIESMASLHRRAAGGLASLTRQDVAVIEAATMDWPAKQLAEQLGLEGPRMVLALACASSSMAILHGAEMIRRGVVDRAVVGGFDAITPFVIAGFRSIGALSTTGCRPFDRRRDGTVLGEGAALLVLEASDAIDLGIRGSDEVLALFEGGGFAADGAHLTAPDREARGLLRAMSQAFRDADISPVDVGYINAHGTGTRYNDAMECRALTTIYGELGRRPPPVSSCKGAFGHTLGAAGALDAIVTIEALRRGFLPPTVGGAEEPEVEGWDFLPGRGRAAPDLRLALSISSGFGGNNTALLFSRPERPTGPHYQVRIAATEARKRKGKDEPRAEQGEAKTVIQDEDANHQRRRPSALASDRLPPVPPPLVIDTTTPAVSIVGGRAQLPRPASTERGSVVISGGGVITWAVEGSSALASFDASREPDIEEVEPGVRVPFGRIGRIRRHPLTARCHRMAQLDAFGQYAVVAAIHALDDAELEVPLAQGDDIGVLLGTTFGCQEANAHFDVFDLAGEGGVEGVRPAVFKSTVDNVAAAWTAMLLGARGVNATWVGGRAAGAEALMAGIWALESGRARAVLAGGADRVVPFQVAAQHRRGLEPFGAEGGAMLVLESEASAADRGHRPRARIRDAGRVRGEADALIHWLRARGVEPGGLAEVSLVAARSAALDRMATALQRLGIPLRREAEHTGETFAVQAPLALLLLVERLQGLRPPARGLLVVDGDGEDYLLFIVER